VLWLGGAKSSPHNTGLFDYPRHSH